MNYSYVLCFRLFTGTSMKIMDTHPLIRRSDAPAKAVLAFDPTFVKFSESRLWAQYFVLVTSGSVWGGDQGAVVTCSSALLRFPLAEKLKAWIVLVDTLVKLDLDTAD